MSESTSSAVRRFVLALAAGLALLAGWNVVKHIGPIQIGESEIAKKVSTATTEYRNALADVADKYAEAPKATVTETMEAIRVDSEKARDAYRKKLSDVMQPELSPIDPKTKEPVEDLDAAVAKRVFTEVAKGFRK